MPASISVLSGSKSRLVDGQQLFADGQRGVQTLPEPPARMMPLRCVVMIFELIAASAYLVSACRQFLDIYKISCSMRSTPCCQSAQLHGCLQFCVFRREFCGRAAGVGKAVVSTAAMLCTFQSRSGRRFCALNHMAGIGMPVGFSSCHRDKARSRSHGQPHAARRGRDIGDQIGSSRAPH